MRILFLILMISFLNQKAFGTAARLQFCTNEGCTELAKKQCLKCKQVKYCGQACQKEDWRKRHKKYCRALLESITATEDSSSTDIGAAPLRPFFEKAFFGISERNMHIPMKTWIWCMTNVKIYRTRNSPEELIELAKEKTRLQITTISEESGQLVLQGILFVPGPVQLLLLAADCIGATHLEDPLKRTEHTITHTSTIEIGDQQSITKQITNKIPTWEYNPKVDGKKTLIDWMTKKALENNDDSFSEKQVKDFIQKIRLGHL